uniref:RmlD-like substrate binding domain-containing protein n=1 Tax=viral metagenome TaxID=1070528 RepID=A0A6C0KQN5_9ZZZZ
MELKFHDNRGTLFFINKNNLHYKQTTISCNKKNVFRGIHINNFEKLVTCIQGKILDIIINFDESAPDYLEPKYYELDPLTELFQILVPPNYGHAFLSLEENSILVYNLAGEFSQENTKHIHFLDPYINMNFLPKTIDVKDLIISKNDSIVEFIKPIDYLVFGTNGFLGSNIIKILSSQNKNYVSSNLRLNEIDKIKTLIQLYKPKYIINCAGISGKPNIFWCDDNKIETIESNLTYQLTLAALCKEHNIHLTVFGSGGIFNNDKIYLEEDIGNNYNNFYGKCRILLEDIISNYNNVLYLRINYPLTSQKCNKNLLTKLLNYKTIDDCEISITYIDDLFLILIKMIENNEIGICNFTNPGQIKLTDILRKYQEISNKNLNIIVNSENIDNKRSLAKLQTCKIEKYNPLNINDAIENCIIKYEKNSI